MRLPSFSYLGEQVVTLHLYLLVFLEGGGPNNTLSLLCTAICWQCRAGCFI